MEYLATTIVALLLILMFSIPSIISNLRDIDPVFLSSQSSISTTRKEAESAIYRSVDVPHGLPLNTGLRIQTGYKLRDGTLKDIWYQALKNATTVINVGGLNYSLGKLNKLMLELSSSLDSLTRCRKVGLFSDCDNLGGLLLMFESFFISGRTLVTFNSIPKKKVEDLDLIVVDSKHLEKVLKLGFKSIIVIGDDYDLSSVTFPKEFNVIGMNSLVDLTSNETNTEMNYSPKEHDMNVNVQPYTEVNNFKEYRYFQRNFVSSIASQLMSLSSDFSWNEDDKLVVGLNPLDPTTKTDSILKILSGLLSKVNSIRIVNEGTLSAAAIVEYKPTILSVSDTILRLFLNDKGKSGNPVKRLLIDRSNYLNSNGVFTKLGKSYPLNLKLIYSHVTMSPLSSLQYTTLKSILHSRIIREKSIVGSLGPILKTNVFEYRVLNNEQTSKCIIRQLGVASNSIEMKILKKGGDDASKFGKLIIRGFNLCKCDDMYLDEEMWVDSGLFGKFGNDGCFYEYSYFD